MSSAIGIPPELNTAADRAWVWAIDRDHLLPLLPGLLESLIEFLRRSRAFPDDRLPFQLFMTGSQELYEVGLVPGEQVLVFVGKESRRGQGRG